MLEQLARQYEQLKATAIEALGGVPVAELISEMASRSRGVLQRGERIALTSNTGKSYFSFRGAQQSRPVNAALYEDNERQFARLLRAFRAGLASNTAEDIVRAVYSIAFSVFGAYDISDIGRKASATFFEILIGHIVARGVGTPPRTRVRIPESPEDDPAYLPTDYLFDPGPRSRKLHLPIKVSTRERAVQAWVHQLVLERIFGAGQYRGVLVVATETKRDSRTGQVIEICVPRQLQLFQARLTEMTRVYYLDPPRPYLNLADANPTPVAVKSFGDALSELPQLLLAR
ncbi:MAG TPA: hypothetical protein VMB47_10555 [Candidatus Aquilonibacter sp.]|nr:hypothetical protein [Candidatus Aquilonibacter sp.]